MRRYKQQGHRAQMEAICLKIAIKLFQRRAQGCITLVRRGLMFVVAQDTLQCPAKPHTHKCCCMNLRKQQRNLPHGHVLWAEGCGSAAHAAQSVGDEYAYGILNAVRQLKEHVWVSTASCSCCCSTGRTRW